MSHHLDYVQDARLDISDVYCFRGTSGTVFVMNLSPLAPSGFRPEARYDFRIDLNGDSLEDLTLRATLPIVDGVQRLKLEQLTGKAARDPGATGKVITPVGAKPEQIVTCSNGIKLFAGERGEPFFNDPRLLLEIKRAMKTGTAPNFTTYDPRTAQNGFGDSNVSAIVMEVPSAITGTGTIGFWGTTSFPTDAGGWRQIQHAAHPAINFIWTFPTDYNAVHPRDQKATFGDQIVKETAAVVNAMGTYDDPPHGRATPQQYAEYVRDTLLPDVLRYKVGSVAEWAPRSQNGKGLTEQFMEAVFELVLNTHVEMGLDAGDATGTLLNAFPYLAEPIPADQPSILAG